MTPQIFSDLSDLQWDRVRSSAFPDDPAADTLRKVIDALLFRELAQCPWAVLPPDFPEIDQLKAHAKTWAVDGTWKRILRALQEPASTGAPPAPPGLRRKLATILRGLPGGALLLAPIRQLIRAAQWLLSRNTPLAQLPTTYRTARIALDGENFAAAVDLYTHILTLVPMHAEARLNRGLAYHRLGRHREALADGLRVLTLQNLTLEDRIRANTLLWRFYFALGDRPRAVGHAYLARLVKRYPGDAPWSQDNLVEEPDEFELLAEAHCEVGEYAINFASDFAAAADLARRREDVQAEYIRWLEEVPADTLYLSGDWARNLGHIALLDYWAKIHHLGWLDRSRIVLHAPPGQTANRAYLSYFKPHLKVIADPAVGGATRHLAATFGTNVASVLHLPGRPDKYFLEGMGAIQEEWERQGRGPLLQLTDEDREFGLAMLREMGIPNGAWFVALHVRSPGFHGEQQSPFQTHRNADVATYLPAIREIVGRGGWVVRLGDKTMPPLPPTPGSVDYATGPHKSDRMDVFLCAACRFFVGVASGMAQVPITFGVPSIFSNWMSNALPVNSRRDLFIPKLVWSDSADRVLTFDEWLQPANRSRYIAATEMRRAGLREVDNAPEELCEIVVEMLDQLDGRAVSDPSDDVRLEVFDTLARRHGTVGFARMGRTFLRRHQHLLPQTNRMRQTG